VQRPTREEDIRAIREVVMRYQRAHEEQDWDGARACHGPTYFRFAGKGSHDPLDWMPGAFFTREAMEQWGSIPPPAGAEYRNGMEILCTRVREDLGVVVTCESGCWEADGGTLQRWEGDVNVWFVGRLDGEWKILAAFFRQQGLPE